MSKRELNIEDVRPERMLLGALLVSAHAFHDIEHRIRADHFILPLHRDVFSAVADLVTSGRKPSISVVATRLPEEVTVIEGQDPQEARDYLTILADEAGESGVSAVDFADEIAEKAGRRRLEEIGKSLVKHAKSSEKPVADIALAAETAIQEARSVGSNRRPVKLGEAAMRLVQKSNTAQASRSDDVLPGLTTGLQKLDNLLGLILPGDAGYFLMAQGEGKSALATQVGRHMAKRGPVLFFQLEMSDEQMAAREVADVSGVSVSRIHEGDYQFGDRARLDAAAAQLMQENFYIKTEKRMTLRAIRAEALAMKRNIGLTALFVDQFDKIKYDGSSRDKFDRMEETTLDIKDLAIELQAPLIVLCQRTRTSQRSDSPVPTINDADTRGIERNGDWVLAGWRHSNWLQQNKPLRKAGGDAWEKWEHEVRRTEKTFEAITLKHRRRKAFQREIFGWDGEKTRVSDDLLDNVSNQQGTIEWQ